MTGNSLIDRLGATTKNDKNSDELHKKNKEKRLKGKKEHEERTKDFDKGLEKFNGVIEDIQKSTDSLKKTNADSYVLNHGLEHLIENGKFKSTVDLYNHIMTREEELAKLKDSL